LKKASQIWKACSSHICKNIKGEVPIKNKRTTTTLKGSREVLAIGGTRMLSKRRRRNVDEK